MNLKLRAVIGKVKYDAGDVIVDYINWVCEFLGSTPY